MPQCPVEPAGGKIDDVRHLPRVDAGRGCHRLEACQAFGMSTGKAALVF